MLENGTAQRNSRAALSAFGIVCLAGLLTACAGGAEEDPDNGGSGPGQETPAESFDEQVVGVWESDEEGDPYLEFTDEGRVNGTDGCNGLGGTYEIDGESALVELGPSTLVACEGVDGWLRDVSVVTIDGENMHVENADGEEIGVLQLGE